MDDQHITNRRTAASAASRWLGPGTLPTLAGVALLALAGCNDNNNDIVDPDPSFEMSVEPDSVTLLPGEMTTLDVEIERTGGFDGTVDVMVEDLPEGVTAEDTSIGSAATSATVTLEADAEAPEGAATAQVRGTGTGVDDQVETVQVTVGDDVDVDGFSLSLEPDSITIEQGESDEVTVTVNRQDWEGSVSFEVDENFEDHVTFDPETVEAEETESTMTIDVPDDADTGEHTVTVTGTPDDEELDPVDVELLVEVTEGT